MSWNTQKLLRILRILIIFFFLFKPYLLLSLTIMHLIEHDLLAFNSSGRALHFDGTLCALGDVNVKKMDSGVMEVHNKQKV